MLFGIRPHSHVNMILPHHNLALHFSPVLSLWHVLVLAVLSVLSLLSLLRIV